MRKLLLGIVGGLLLAGCTIVPTGDGGVAVAPAPVVVEPGYSGYYTEPSCCWVTWGGHRYWNSGHWHHWRR